MTLHDDRRYTNCRGCGRKVMFVTTVDGKKVPLDPSAPVYHRVHDPDSGKAFWIQESGGEAMVSHFATCSHANEFSGRNRAAKGGS